MPSLLDLLRAAASGVAGGALGWPADTGVNLANLVRAGYGAGGKSLGLLSTQQMPEMIDPKNVPMTSEHISGLLGVGDSGQEQAVQMLAGLLSPSPGGKSKPMREAVAYHGSPHTFDKFDMSKIGTGEGAQAYGHGLYFAENPGVAKSYQRALSGDNLGGHYLIDGAEKVTGNTPRGMAASVVAGTKSPERLAETIKSYEDYAAKMNDQFARDVAKNVRELQGKKVVHQEPGNMYKVDLPDEHIAKMLDWDKPLSQQPQAVKDVFNQITSATTHPLGPGLVDVKIGGGTIGTFSPEKAAHVVANPADYVPMKGQDLYKYLGMNESKSHASERLRAAGIPGIRYLDGGSRSGGKGTSNFVVFDDALPKILSRE